MQAYIAMSPFGGRLYPIDPSATVRCFLFRMLHSAMKNSRLEQIGEDFLIEVRWSTRVAMNRGKRRNNKQAMSIGDIAFRKRRYGYLVHHSCRFCDPRMSLKNINSRQRHLPDRQLRSSDSFAADVMNETEPALRLRYFHVSGSAVNLERAIPGQRTFWRTHRSRPWMASDALLSERRYGHLVHHSCRFCDSSLCR